MNPDLGMLPAPSGTEWTQPPMPNPEAITSEIWALIPVKDFAGAKTRLATALGTEDRRALALAMARDVVRALTRARSIDRVVMVSDIPELRELIDLPGVDCFDTGQARGLNEDLEQATAWAQACGAGHVLIVHADLPHLTAAGIDRFVTSSPCSRTRLLAAASKEGSGTNLLLTPLPLPLPLLFGNRSLPRFIQAASCAGLALEVHRDPALAGDIDEIADLESLRTTCRRGYLAGRETARWLRTTTESHTV